MGSRLSSPGILTLPTIFVRAQKGLSHVRVVRLSYVSGTVGVKRPASTEWAKAQVNTPIQEGFELSTSARAMPRWNSKTAPRRGWVNSPK